MRWVDALLALLFMQRQLHRLSRGSHEYERRQARQTFSATPGQASMVLRDRFSIFVRRSNDFPLPLSEWFPTAIEKLPAGQPPNLHHLGIPLDSKIS